MAEPVCPFPLLVDPSNGQSANSIPNTSCAFACFGTMVTQTELDTLNIVETALAGLSTFCALFLVLTWGLFPQKSKQKMTFWISVCSLFVAVSIFIPALIKGRPEDVWCKNAGEGFSQEDGISLCVVQGVMIIFFGLALCFWWWCSCFDLFSKLFLKKRHIEHYLNYYHLISWSIPGIFTAILLATESYGFEQPRLWCFLDAESKTEYEFVFFYGWVGFLWLTGTIMMFLVFWSIFSQSRNIHSTRGNNKFWTRIKLYRTPITFVLLFSFFWAVFFSFRLITVLDEGQYEDAAEQWITCLLTNAAVVGADRAFDTSNDFIVGQFPFATEGCGEIQPDGIPNALLVTAMITISFQGLLLFLIFATDGATWSLWYNKFCRKKPEATIFNSKPGSSSGGMGAKPYRPRNTCQELGIGVWNIITLAYFRGTAIPTSQPNQNRQPRLRFDKTDSQAYQQNTYVAKYYMGANSVPTGPHPPQFQENQGYGGSTGMQGYSTQLSSPVPPGLGYGQGQNQRMEPFPGNYPYMQGGQAGQTPGGSSFSDWYEDDLWGVNVAF